MRPFSGLTSFDAARELVRSHANPLDRTEAVPLDSAAGRVLARGVVAGNDVPSFDRAAMDGYAVIAGDTQSAGASQPARLRLVTRVHAGTTPVAGLSRGECVAVATGAPLPAGADAVVMVEHTALHGEQVEVLRPAAPGQHIGRAGSDIKAGTTVVERDQELTAGRLAALAAIGTASVEVFSRPRVALMATGDELLAPGATLRPGAIFESNTVSLAAVVRRHGGDPVPFSIVPDTIEALGAALDRALSHDIVVVTGGSSVGDRDLLVDAIHSRAEVLFHGVAVKPGKPTLFARAGRTTILGLPGNPASCLSMAHLLLAPLVRLTGRLPPWRPERVALPLARAIRSTSDRHQFFTVRIADETVEPAFKSSSDTTSLANADGFIEIPAGVDGIEAGTVVTVTLF